MMRFAGFAFALTALLAGPALAQESIPLEADPRSALAVSVYQGDFAVLQDTRRVELPAGELELVIGDLAREIAADTVLLRVPQARVVETRLQADPLTPERLAAAAVGETVEIVRTHPRSGEERRQSARVLSAEDGVLLEMDGRIESLADLPGRLVYPELPPGLTRRPQLSAVVDSTRAGKRLAHLTYQTDGLGWRAGYTAIFAEESQRLELTAMVTLSNESGLDLRKAAVELVAGEVKRVGGEDPQPQRREMMRAAAQSVQADTESQPVQDLHVYRLDRRLTLPDGARKQRRLFGAQDIAAEKRYHFEARGLQSFERPRPARIRLAFANRERDGLGRPLPRGIMRVYAAGTGGGADAERLRLMGEDRLPATPKGRRAELALGPAFDVTVEAQQADRRMLVNTRERRVYEADQRYILRNARERKVVVDLEQAMPGRDWEIVAESRDTAQTRADSATWRVPVPAEGETQLEFTVRVEE